MSNIVSGVDSNDYSKMLGDLKLDKETSEALIADYKRKVEANKNIVRFVIGDYVIEVFVDDKEDVITATFLTINKSSNMGYTYKDDVILDEDGLIELLKDRYRDKEIVIKDSVKRYLKKHCVIYK